MPRVLIIGYGNPLRGDDGLGFVAAGRLRNTLQDPAIEILSVHQLTPELSEPIHNSARVIFIDAAEGPNPGEILRRPVQPRSAPPNFTHHFSPESLLEAAQHLFGSAPPAELFTVTAATFDLSMDLSPAVQNALDPLLALIAQSCRP